MSLIKDYYAEESRLVAEAKKNLLALAAKLRPLGIVQVTAHYDGSGDSGQFESFKAYDGDNNEFDLDEILKNPNASVGVNFNNLEHVEEAFDRILDGKFGGWENNAGAFGDVILFIPDKKSRKKPRVIIQHNYRVEDSVYSEEEA